MSRISKILRKMLSRFNRECLWFGMCLVKVKHTHIHLHRHTLKLRDEGSMLFTCSKVYMRKESHKIVILAPKLVSHFIWWYKVFLPVVIHTVMHSFKVEAKEHTRLFSWEHWIFCSSAHTVPNSPIFPYCKQIGTGDEDFVRYCIVLSIYVHF